MLLAVHMLAYAHPRRSGFKTWILKEQTHAAVAQVMRDEVQMVQH
jgi:hypothetical protein